MKNIFKFFGTILTLVLAASLSGCLAEDELQSADVGLHVKVFFPTKVVKGQPMTINGSGFSDVTEIVFPDGAEGIVVTDFQIVSNEMIRVNAPSGISAEGGKIILRTEAGEQVESPLPLTLGKTAISGYSAVEGEVIAGGSQMTIYGTDLEFVNKIEMLDEDSNPVFIEDKLFNRKGTDHIIFTVPRKVFEGEFEGKVYTIDNRTFKMPLLAYEPAADDGYWETVENVIWENPDPAGYGEISWNGTYRFGLEGTDVNNECITTLPAESWDIIKNGTFRLQFAATAAQLRITTGWWSTTWTGNDIMAGDERIVDNGDGTYYIEINLAGDPILDVLDEQHLLFTGGGYTPLKIYTSEEVWVPGGSVQIVKNVFWKNEDPAGNGEISWSGQYRFGLEGHDGLNECIATFPAETWDIIKNGTFRMKFSATAAQLRITTGWWSTTWTGNDIMAGDERIVDNGDGTYYIEINFAGDPIVDLLDDQHLLFTGGGYTPLELYTEEEVFVPGGGTPTEVVLWEGEAIADDWGNQPTILSDAGLELVDAGATAGQTLYFYFEPLDAAWQVKIVEGHWGPEYACICSEGNDNGGEFTVYDLAGNGGKYGLELTQEILDAALTQQWWGGAFLLNGDNIKCTKVTLL